ncbi:RNA polymerase sigma factor [Sediminitomix flava]|nr:RNA polymerase sigma factor [Sediminitomix flava]
MQVSNGYTEEQILEGCKNNSRKFQKALYDLYSARLMAVAARYAHTDEDAHDILQEAFIKIFKKIDTFRAESHLYAWMKRIVVNTALNFHRSKLYTQPMVDVNEMYDLAEKEYTISHFSYNELKDMLQSLPDGCRMVFNLYAIEGYKHKEISSMLDISEGTSKSQYARAKKLLQELIEKANRSYEYSQR